MRRFAAAIPVAIAAALSLAACGAPRTVVIPAPPSEVRKQAGGPSTAAGERAAPPAPEGEKPRADAAGDQAAAGTKATESVSPPGAGLVMPERLPEYLAAYEKTRQAIARGAASDAAPSWQELEDSKWGTDAVFNQGVLFQIAGDLDRASAQYGRAMDRSPAFEPPLANLLGIALLRGDREAMKSLVTRVAPPGSVPPAGMLPELAVNAAAALMETGRERDAAVLLRALRERGKATPALPWNQAVLAFRDGDPAAARELAKAVSPAVASLYPVVASRFAWASEGEKVPTLGPAPPGMAGMATLSVNLRAFAEYRNGSVAAAEKTLAPTASGKDARAEIMTNIGLLQAEQGRWREARENLERAVRENPALPAAWLNLGIFREVYEGSPSGARECYENYVKLRGSRKEEVRTWFDRLGQSASPRQ